MVIGRVRIAAVAFAAMLLVGPAARDASLVAAAPAPVDTREPVDRYGDPLPPGAVARFGTVRYRFAAGGAGFLPDGKTVVSTKENAIQFWDARTGRLLREIDTGRIGTGMGSTALSRDGKRLAVSGSISEDGKPGWRSAVRVYDLASGKVLRTFERDPSEGLNALALTPDGELLFTLDGSGKLRVEEVATGAELLQKQFPGDVLPALTLSPDGSMLALGSGRSTRKLFVWKWQTAEEPRAIVSGLIRAGDLAFSPDGKLLAMCNDDGPDVRILDVASGRLRHKLELPDHEPYRHYYVAFSPDGTRIAAYGGTNERRVVHLWDPATGKFLQRLDMDGGSLAFSPDGKLLVCGSQIWDFAADKEVSANDEAARGEAERIVTGVPDLVATVNGHDTICIWDAATGKLRRRLMHEGWVWDIALSPDGTRLVSSSLLSDTVCLWDVATGKQIYRLPGHGQVGGRRAVAFTPDGKSFLSWGDDMYLRRWDVRTGKALAEFAIRPTGVKVPSEDEDDFNLRRDEFSVGGGRFTPDGKRLVLQIGARFFVFDTATGKEVRFFPSEGNFPNAIAVSPDSKLVLTSAWGQPVQTKLPDGTIQFSPPKQHPVTWWDLNSGEVRKQVLLPEDGSGPVAFAPDGKLFAVATSHPGSCIHLMETATGQEVRKIEGFRGAVRSLAFMPDGKRLVSGLDDSTALVWDLDRER